MDGAAFHPRDKVFLCDEDKLTGRSDGHRRGLIVNKTKSYPAIFCIAVPMHSQ